MENFFVMIQSLLENNITLEQEISVFDELKIQHNECLYVIDFNQNELILKRGFESLLGYTDEEMNMSLLVKGYHPNDEEIIKRVVQEAVLFTLKNAEKGQQNELYLKYRRRKKDGTYITVLSQTYIHDLEADGSSMRSLTRLTDISFTSDFYNVSYFFKAANLDQDSFEREIHKVYYEFFTKRELDIIKNMNQGYTNKQISEILFISEHTVATHRKNIFRKSGCHSLEELLRFCHSKGILKILDKS